MRAALALLIAFAFGLAAANADERPAAPPLSHGREITRHSVGPQAAGYRDLKIYAGGEIKDGRAYPFAREVPASASYDGFKVEGPHLLIEGVAFTSALDISRSTPVVLRGVSVRVPPGSPWTILVRPQAGVFHLLWSDAGGNETAGKPPASGLDIRNTASVIYRSHLSRAADGIDISARNVLISESLIDELANFPGSHNDAIQLAGTAADIKIERSRILNANPQTSCLYILGRNISITGNALSGGGWTIYGGAKNNGKGGAGASGVAVTDTIFGREYYVKSGNFGPLTYWDAAAPGNVWKNNRFSDGAAIDPK